MNDMNEAIIPKSDQINADDLISGPRTITVERVEIKGGTEQPVSIFFKGSTKAYRPCKSMSRVLVFAWGPDAKIYTGRSMTIYRDPSVKWGGMEVGGIRISHLSDIAEPLQMALTATKGRRASFIVKPLAAQSTSQPDGELKKLKSEAWALLKTKLGDDITPEKADSFLWSKEILDGGTPDHSLSKLSAPMLRTVIEKVRKL